MHNGKNTRRVAELMRADALLPHDVVPEQGPTSAGNAALVTGATGFLGRYVVRELLHRPDMEIYCLVRAVDPTAAWERLRGSLQAARLDLASHQDRIHVLAGAADQPQLGLSDQAYSQLAGQIGAIYHCAANVNWARGYRRLRASNVLGTLELIRLACTGPVKRFYFSSTIAVCFASPGPDEVDETTDMLPYVEQMPLPYAQSKCVAESLLRAASKRGLPVSIIRPALISGDSVSGDANRDDLICALVQGCVASGAAIDSDWQLDCVPVDYVARVLAALGDSGCGQWQVLNLFNDRGRHWREVVLWMNLYGYPVQLVPHGEWLRRTFDRASAPRSLFGYRRFFGAASSRLPGPAPYETYLEHAQGRVRNDMTREVLAALSLSAPPLDAELIERYFEHYVAKGIVPRARRHRVAGRQRSAACSTLEQAIGERLAAQELTLVAVRERPIAAHNGIFNEIAAARVGGHIGIRRYDVLLRERSGGAPQTHSVLLKSKPSDTLMQDILVEVATLCDPTLGTHCETFKNDLGLAGCHERELALYELPEPRLSRHMPVAMGTHRDPHSGTWSVAMEYLDAAETVNAAATTWTSGELDGILQALSSVHAIWYRRQDELQDKAWMVPPPNTARMLEMTPFWTALTDHSSRFFTPWVDEPLLPLQRALIASLGDWWPALRALPQTLIHNDFNPRNLVLRGTESGFAPNIFDWELATVGVPQHDLAELLCFALPPDSKARDLAGVLELHRRALQSAAGVPIDPDQWLQGFVLSLRYLIVYRLPLYTLMHRFKRQAFLPRVIRNWARLYRLSSSSGVLPLDGARRQPDQHNQQGGYEQIFGEDTQRAAYVEPKYIGHMGDVQ